MSRAKLAGHRSVTSRNETREPCFTWPCLLYLPAFYASLVTEHRNRFAKKYYSYFPDLLQIGWDRLRFEPIRRKEDIYAWKNFLRNKSCRSKSIRARNGDGFLRKTRGSKHMKYFTRCLQHSLLPFPAVSA